MHVLPLTAVVLAGGRGSRLGGRDKALVEVAGRALIEHILTALQPQVEQVMINANRNGDRYGRYRLPVFADQTDDYAGPLAGMLAALEQSPTPLVLFIPGDAPIVDGEYAERMLRSLNAAGSRAAVAVCNGELQAVHCLLHCSLADSIKTEIGSGQRSVKKWLRRNAASLVDFSDKPQQFLNLNTDSDMALLESAVLKERAKPQGDDS